MLVQRQSFQTPGLHLYKEVYGGNPVLVAAAISDPDIYAAVE